jgi:hypothetical protein
MDLNKSAFHEETPEPKIAAAMKFVENSKAAIAINPSPVVLLDICLTPLF